MKSLVIFFLFTLTRCSNVNEERSLNSDTPVTGEIEKVKLYNLTGAQIDLSEYKGRTVFINFWATWCRPCLEEMPAIKSAMNSLRNEKIDFLFASDETAAQIEDFERQHNYQFNYLTTTSMDDLGITGLPTTFVFDKNGKLVFSEMGYRKWNDKANLDLLMNIIKNQ